MRAYRDFSGSLMNQYALNYILVTILTLRRYNSIVSKLIFKNLKRIFRNLKLTHD